MAKTKSAKRSASPKIPSPAVLTHAVPSAPQPSYLGSQEHKTYPSPLGEPRPRSDATKCPKDVVYADAQRLLTEAIQVSILNGCHSALKDGQFPRYVWGKVQAGTPPRTIYFEARLINREQGAYKAWPIEQRTHESDHLSEKAFKLLWHS